MNYQATTDRMINIIEELETGKFMASREEIEYTRNLADEFYSTLRSLPREEQLAFVALIQTTGMAIISQEIYDWIAAGWKGFDELVRECREQEDKDWYTREENIIK